ncbi:hypothetical protein FHX76_001553 [Lysinibacter cavernae]|uniref:CprB tetracyclin repressor-like C-terminal domain-containing protein n=2 Tax=Lysinibacter cavernae TaxID=1640652 RepID=A0A7X5R0Z1_9MICO|nr:hypothetical protein [Lysinibacter cavernae]NIH53685.1 hypothetical protein [Lysinibacter cavernae]
MSDIASQGFDTAATAVVVSPDDPLATIVRFALSVGYRYIHDVPTRAVNRLLDESIHLPLGIPAPYVDWIQLAEHLLRQAIALGQLHNTIDPAKQAVTLVAGMTGIQRLSELLDERDLVLERVAEMLTVVFSGMGAANANDLVGRVAAEPGPAQLLR